MGGVMGRVKAGLAEKAVAKLAKRDGMHAVGDPPGTYLCVSGEARSWILRYSSPSGQRRDFGLGSYSDYTLAEARDRAREARKLVHARIDPIEAKRAGRDAAKAAQARRMTFAECVTAYIGAHGDS